MPAEFTSEVGENGLFGSGSIGMVFCGCCTQVSHDPSNSETRRRLSLNNASSLSFNPVIGIGMAEGGFGRGPGSFALNRFPAFSANMTDVAIKARAHAQAAACFVLTFIPSRFILPTSLQRFASKSVFPGALEKRGHWWTGHLVANIIAAQWAAVPGFSLFTTNCEKGTPKRSKKKAIPHFSFWNQPRGKNLTKPDIGAILAQRCKWSSCGACRNLLNRLRSFSFDGGRETRKRFSA